ncbi:proton-translocating NADH-quinone oxidoreductase, chain N [Helicobacter didelphidarum]|uniref:NADH-quinone oxidoreductase subunit N n=1 Tax=Helicobacter didelphidarum TaxID=2040648 RepID=A0A3D8IBS3_9HELI|nr:NADH-quinone oxidoreductase subunit N [Helicobacter didelphidarum]RDU62607.1 proton-translocating NADH-quinone oxidoreductase, chain N [Helicobacter didelphidarum]
MEIDFYKFFYAYMPSVILVVGAIVVLFGNTFAHSFSRSTSLSLSMIFIISAVLFCMSIGHIESVSNITHVSEMIILVVGCLFILLTFSKYRFTEFQTPEFYPLYLFSLSGFLLMVGADNFILMLLGLEIGSLPLCVLIAFNRRIYGIEAGIKYFISSALASIFLLIGILLFYLYSGSFELNVAMSHYHKFAAYEQISHSIIALCGIIFLFAGIGFKISLVPWHNWMPDVYEGSNPVIAGFISIVPKIAGFAVFASIFGVLFSGDFNDDYINKILKTLIYITITLPNIAALLQKDVKRMLAFSSISHSGFALACIYLDSFNTLILYWILFAIANLGSFALLWCNKPKDFHSRYDYAFERFYGFAKVKPIMALGISLFMLTLAGIPPLSIFWGKIFIINAALSKGEIALSIVMLLNSAIAVCYYLKLPVAMFFKQPITNKDSNSTNVPYRQMLSYTNNSTLINYYEDNSTIPIKAVGFISAMLCVCSIFVVSYFFEIIALFEF